MNRVWLMTKVPLREQLRIREYRKNKHAPLECMRGKYRGVKVCIVPYKTGYKATTNLNQRVFTQYQLNFMLRELKEHIDQIKDFRQEASNL